MILDAKRPRRHLFVQGTIGVLGCAARKLSVIATGMLLTTWTTDKIKLVILNNYSDLCTVTVKLKVHQPPKEQQMKKTRNAGCGAWIAQLLGKVAG